MLSILGLFAIWEPGGGGGLLAHSSPDQECCQGAAGAHRPPPYPVPGLMPVRDPCDMIGGLFALSARECAAGFAVKLESSAHLCDERRLEQVSCSCCYLSVVVFFRILSFEDVCPLSSTTLFFPYFSSFWLERKPGAPRGVEGEWEASGTYLGLRFPRHGLEQLVEMGPVPLGVPAGFVESQQALALLHVVHCTGEGQSHAATMLQGQGHDEDSNEKLPLFPGYNQNTWK